jgi:hypothetical protein
VGPARGSARPDSGYAAHRPGRSRQRAPGPGERHALVLAAGRPVSRPDAPASPATTPNWPAAISGPAVGSRRPRSRRARSRRTRSRRTRSHRARSHRAGSHRVGLAAAAGLWGSFEAGCAPDGAATARGTASARTAAAPPAGNEPRSVRRSRSVRPVGRRRPRTGEPVPAGAAGGRRPALGPRQWRARRRCPRRLRPRPVGPREHRAPGDHLSTSEHHPAARWAGRKRSRQTGQRGPERRPRAPVRERTLSQYHVVSEQHISGEPGFLAEHHSPSRATPAGQHSAAQPTAA